MKTPLPGTYVLKSTFNIYVQLVKAWEQRYLEKTESFDRLSKDYNTTLGIIKVQQSKIAFLESACSDHLRSKNISDTLILRLREENDNKNIELKQHKKLYWIYRIGVWVIGIIVLIAYLT